MSTEQGVLSIYAGLVTEFLDTHARTVLYKHFKAKHLCIAAARMVYDFCKKVNVPCNARAMTCVIRNQNAIDADAWPWDHKGADKSCAIILLGNGPKPTDDDLSNIHVVPVILDNTGDCLIDVTLDSHTNLPKYGFSPLPTIIAPFPPDSASIICGDIPGMDITYIANHRTDYLSAPYWSMFDFLGGKAAVDELIQIWSSKS